MTEKKVICPRCNMNYIPNNATPGLYPGALSRVDNKTEICSSCGVEEAFEEYLALDIAPKNDRIIIE